MKKLLFILALALVALTTSAVEVPAYNLTVGTSEHGTIAFKVGSTTVTTASEGDQVTVTVTPATGYATKEVTAVAYALPGEAQSPQRAGIDMLKDIAVTGSANTWTFTMPAAHALVSATYTRVIQNSWIQPETIDDLPYTGKGLEPQKNATRAQVAQIVINCAERS